MDFNPEAWIDEALEGGELRKGDHIGIETAGFRFFGTYESYKRAGLTMVLDSGETITIKFGDIKNFDGRWPQT